SIEINNSIEEGVPDAVITFKTPKYGAKKFLVAEGFESSIFNYSEIEIYIKGRFLVKQKAPPSTTIPPVATSYQYVTNYYKAFHGFTTHFDDNYTLSCVGYL